MKLDRNIVRITNIETTLHGISIVVSVNNFKMADSSVSLIAGKTQNWGFFETKTLIGLWAEEDIKRQLASIGCIKKNIWEGITVKFFFVFVETELCGSVDFRFP